MARRSYGPDEVWEFEPGTVVVNVVCANHRLKSIPRGQRTDHLYCIIKLVVESRPDNSRVFRELEIVGGGVTRRMATEQAPEFGQVVGYAFNRRLVRNLSREVAVTLGELR